MQTDSTFQSSRPQSLFETHIFAIPISPYAVSADGILVPKPEHLAAMKVVAMKNDPSRVFKISPTCASMELPGVDREEIRGYFAKHGLTSRFHELEKTR